MRPTTFSIMDSDHTDRSSVYIQIAKFGIVTLMLQHPDVSVNSQLSLMGAGLSSSEHTRLPITEL